MLTKDESLGENEKERSMKEKQCEEEFQANKCSNFCHF